MREYRKKEVTGFISDIRTPVMSSCNVTVRMTSDDIGQTLSLTGANILIGIPLEEVADIIKVVER